MQLTGNATEDEHRTILRKVTAAFERHLRYAEVLLALGIAKESRSSIVALDIFPDGGCDFLRALIPNETIATVDLPWDEDEPIDVLELTPLKTYSRGLKRCDQIKLAVAVNLLSG